MSSSSSSHDEFVVNPSACFQPISQLSILNISPTVVLSEEELREKAWKEAEHCQDDIRRLQLRCLAAGLAGPKSLIRKLHTLEKPEVNANDFVQCIRSVPMLKQVPEAEMRQAFIQMARDADEMANAGDVTEKLMPPISASRRALVQSVFSQMGPQPGEDFVPLAAFGQHFDHRRQAQFQSGAKSKEELLSAFLAQFHPDPDGRVFAQEFLAFYAALSATVASDIHFDWLVRNTWKI